MNYTREQLIKDVNEAERLLIGIGKEFFNIDDLNHEIKDAYDKLSIFIKDKEYFIITLATDDLIYNSSFDKERIVAPCGSINRYQCTNNCENRIFTCDEYKKQEVCPVCGEPLVNNTVEAVTYNEEGYLGDWQKYTRFLQGTLNKKTVLLELGVGMQFPQIIRFPFEKTCFYNNKATFYRINKSFSQLPVEIVDKAYEVNTNAVAFCRNEFVL